MDFNVYLPATTLAAVINGALLFLMTTGIGLIRNKSRISFGDGGDARFAKRQRGHANGVEQIPIALILLALAELQGAPSWLVWSTAIGLSVGRIFHAVQFWFKNAPFLLRPVGVILTLIAKFGVLIWLAGAILY